MAGLAKSILNICILCIGRSNWQLNAMFHRLATISVMITMVLTVIIIRESLMGEMAFSLPLILPFSLYRARALSTHLSGDGIRCFAKSQRIESKITKCKCSKGSALADIILCGSTMFNAVILCVCVLLLLYTVLHTHSIESYRKSMVHSF